MIPIGGDSVIEDAGEVQLRLFGIPQRCIAVSDRLPEKGFVLIAALLLAPHQVLTRQAAASLLWENGEDKRVFGNLRQLLLRLQKLCGEEGRFIESDGHYLKAGALARRSDLWCFLEGSKADAVAERVHALLAVSGELLQGFDTGIDHFQLWLLAERRRLKEFFFHTYVQVLEELTRFGRARLKDIAKLTEIALRLDPSREETHRVAIAAYARMGAVEECDRLFENLRLCLSLEKRTPDQETVALLRRVQSVSLQLPESDLRGSVTSQATHRSKQRVAFLRPVRIDGSPALPIIDAFVEDVANSLVRYRTFSVLATHSTFVAGAGKRDDRFATLRADYSVVTRVLDRTRLTVSLIAEGLNEIVWSLEVELRPEQVHAAFRLLSKQVATALAREIERLQIDTGRELNDSAYRVLLDGQQLLSGKCDLPLVRRARSMFRKAISLDQGLAVARARIAQTLQLEWLMLGGNDHHLLHRAKAEAEAAIEIDPALAAGHWMSAVVALYQRDFDRSAQTFFEAEALAPHSADLLLQHADALAHFGDCDAAWLKFQHAIDLNPLAPDIYWWAGASIAFDRKDYACAVELCTKMKDDEPALRVLTASHALNGNLESARLSARRLQENYPGMTARDIAALSPDRDPAANENFYEALRLAGIK
jgi:DNA-binding SARP family transcriptional activator/Flp pilus assembly protein TadD